LRLIIPKKTKKAKARNPDHFGLDLGLASPHQRAATAAPANLDPHRHGVAQP
jgi:hypothetical protein